jgi:hypothetical protein
MIWYILIWIAIAVIIVWPLVWAHLQTRHWYPRTVRAFLTEWVIALWFTLVITTLSMFILTLILAGVNMTTMRVEQSDEWDVRLKALSTQTDTDGRFFLGSGYIDEEPVFSYITQEGNGSYKLRWVDADKSAVFEDETGPKIVVKEYKYVHDNFIAPFTILSGNVSYEYEFHIPRGSVVNTFEVKP